VAGNGTFGYSGDGGPAVSAQLATPYGVAVDSSGNLFIADAGNYRVRKVSPSGIITTVAGNGVFGYSGDGGPATHAQLDTPYAVAVDAAGKVYIADWQNNSIRLLTPVGTPAISSNGVVEGAGYRPVLAPGGIASVFGTSLAGGTVNATGLLPTALGGTSVEMGGINVPLFYVSPTQINFQVPWEFTGVVGASNVEITAASGTSAVHAVSLAAVSPGIFTVNSSGSGLGAVTITSTGQIAAAATPAPRGQYISIYCSGLGAVNNPPLTGAPASADTLAFTTQIPTVTIGGVPAPVHFSGLAPSFVGLYQVDVQVPVNVTPGPAVSLVLAIGGVASNTVTAAVQ
jgi:uncharacterized protein (TIGR03437 family)